MFINYGDNILKVGLLKKIGIFSVIGASSSVLFSSALCSIFVFLMIISFLFSPNLYNNLKFTFKRNSIKSLFFFLIILISGCFFGLVDLTSGLDTTWSWRKIFLLIIPIILFTSDDDKNLIIKSYLVVTIIGLFTSYLDFFSIINIEKGWSKGVVLKNHSAQGIFFSISILFLCNFIKSSNLKIKFFILSFIILFILNVIYITPGRTGYLALTVVILFISNWYFGQRKFYLTLLFIIFLLSTLYFISPPMQKRISQGITELGETKSEDLTSIGFRKIALINSLEIIKINPFFGNGTGSFESVYTKHVSQKYNDWRSEGTSDPHNQYIFIFVENGLIGLIVFLTFIFFIYKEFEKDNKYDYLAKCIITLFVCTSLFNSHFKTFTEAHLLTFLIGSLISKKE